MPQQTLIPAPLMWVFLFFSLAVSVATRQLIWLMVVVTLGGLLTDRKAVVSTEGMKRAALLFSCIAIPGFISLIMSVNPIVVYPRPFVLQLTALLPGSYSAQS
jgi:hypothetical protein